MSAHDLWETFRTQPGAEMLSTESMADTYLDVAELESFWHQWYLHEMVPAGYGKVKFLFGGMGSGKTHFLRHLAFSAREAGYATIFFDARRVPLSDIEEFYRAMSVGLPWDAMIATSCQQIIARDLGYREFTGSPQQFLGWAESTRGLDAALLRRDIREAVDHWLLTQDLAQDFVLAVRSWMNQQLLNELDQPTPRQWLEGERLSASQRKSLGVAVNISRRNARAMVSSAVTFCHHCGFPGVLVLVDNLEVMATTQRTDDALYYTRGKRDQAYEMIRQLIDESVHTPYLMIVIAGNETKLSDPRAGFPSYPALWARIHSEIATARVNRFADGIAVDTLWQDDANSAEKLAQLWAAHPLSLDDSTGPQPREGIGLEWSLPRRVVTLVLTNRQSAETEETRDE